jgi:recombination DNA repair RAD52 pathway protein
MLTDEQRELLLGDLQASRVAKRSQGNRSLSYLEAWDVKAHLNRIFGFCNWSADVLGAELAFEEQNEKKQWHVGYKVVLRLRIGGCSYTEAAVGFATLPSRGEAHDMAVKTAESDALKRAAINLGTQFGLSLYNNGSLKDVVRRTPRPAHDDVIDNDTLHYWVDRFAQCVDRATLAAAWLECKDAGVSRKPAVPGGPSVLLDAVNERLAELENVG